MLQRAGKQDSPLMAPGTPSALMELDIAVQ